MRWPPTRRAARASAGTPRPPVSCSCVGCAGPQSVAGGRRAGASGPAASLHSRAVHACHDRRPSPTSRPARRDRPHQRDPPMRRILVPVALPMVLCTACADVQAHPPLLPFAATPPHLQDALPPKTGAPRMPKEGDSVLDMRLYYGIPILQKSFFWDGNGEVDQFGVKVRYLHHSSDLVALGAGLTAMNFLLGGSDVQALEAEGVGR